MKPRYSRIGYGTSNYLYSRAPEEVRDDYLKWAKAKGLTGVTLWIGTPWSKEERATFPDARFVTKDEYFRVITEHDDWDNDAWIMASLCKARTEEQGTTWQRLLRFENRRASVARHGAHP